MLTDSERHVTIEQIAANLEQFDDETLQEMARLTDPSTRAPISPAPLATPTRRQVLAGFAAGAGTVAAAFLGVSHVRGSAPLGDDDAARLRRIAALGRELEAVGLDETVGSGLTAVGSALDAASAASAEANVALRDVAPDVEAAVALVDPDLADRARYQLFDPLSKLAAAVDSAATAWGQSLESPVTEQLEHRATLRRQLSDLGL